jgi:hypothetical protein
VSYFTLIALHPVIFPRIIEQSNNVEEFAVTSRRPTFIRWAEEAEAKHICEWAEFDQTRDRPDIDTERSPASGERPSFLRRLRGLFASQVAQN